MKKMKKVATGCLISLLTTVLLLAAAEGVCGLLNHWGKPGDEPPRVEDAFSNRADPVLGYRPYPHRTATDRVKGVHGEVIAEVVYRTDEVGRRVTPKPSVRHPKGTLLFLGDSFTFGEMVDDHETMPSVAAKLVPHYQVFNYGMSGYGSQHVLARLEEGKIAKEFKAAPPVILVYTFIGSHVRRTAGTMRYYVAWMANSPYYELTDDGAGVVRKGSFRTGHPVRSLLYGFVGRTQIATYFKLDWPLRVRPKDVELTCRVIEAARNRFQELFKSDRFYVLLYPNRERLMQTVKARLKELKVRTLDYSTLVDWKDKRFHIPFDKHPTPELHHIVAAHLVRDLGLHSQ